MLGGRAAWNVVTSVNDGEAQNMGREVHLAHDLRYDRADEFMEIVLGCWDGWEDDALVVDKQSGLFADPDKVHRMEYRGKYLTSRGTFTVPRSPQGHPVIIQAGSSDRGMQFSRALGGDGIRRLPGFRGRQAALCRLQGRVSHGRGRDPDLVTVNTIAYPVAAATKAEAEDKMALIDSCTARSTACRCCPRR